MKNKVALLDKEYGRLDALVLNQHVMTGSIISYRLVTHYNNVYLLRDIVLDDVPFDLARADILFLHHLLELCYHFIPVASSVHDLFDLLLFLYSAEEIWWTRAKKKLFLFRLLMTIGFYSTQLAADKTIVKQLMQVPFDTIVAETYAKEYEEAIGDWLRYCVSEHPHVQKFNTMHFLVRE